MIRRLIVFALVCVGIVACGGRASGPGALPNAALPGGVASRGIASSQAGSDGNVNEMPEAPVVRAVNGVAKFTLVANVNPATGLPSFDYKNLHGIAPTIIIDPGDTFEIDLVNDLSPSAGMAALMNLHFHGLTVSPHAPGDDVLTMVSKPGQSLKYVVHVPTNQEPGLYWYHPHIHGETSYQVGEGGMSGAIVINGIEKHIPEIAHMRQRVIVVRSTGIGINAPPAGSPNGAPASGGSMAGMNMASDAIVRPDHSNTAPCVTSDKLTTTLNTAYQPQITISPGERQFFRVINATGHKTLKLNIQGVQLKVVAVDGYALDTHPGTKPIVESSVIIPPAARAEFIVTGPKQTGSAGRTFSTLCYNTGPNGDPDPPIVLGSIVAPVHREIGDYSTAPLTVGAPLPSNSYDTALPAPAAKRLVVFSEDSVPNFFINGKMYNPNSPPMFVVHAGTTELWHVENVTKEIHDFHIHQIHFLVQKVNGVPMTQPYWADSFIIPHSVYVKGHSVPGSIDLLMDFRDPIIKGLFLFHCHILDHEDEGMMAKIQVI